MRGGRAHAGVAGGRAGERALGPGGAEEGGDEAADHGLDAVAGLDAVGDWYKLRLFVGKILWS